MPALKEQLHVYAKNKVADRMRLDVGLQVNIKRPVIVLSGNPGTGKTSVAAIIAGIMFHNN